MHQAHEHLNPSTLERLEHLPQVALRQLDSICRQIDRAMSPNQSTNIAKANIYWLILYGSATHPSNWDENSSDLNILCVHHDNTTSTALLDRLHLALKELSPLWSVHFTIMSRRELEESTDVFPLRYLDMQRHHVMLHGPEDAIAALSISWAHLRLQLEQRLRSLAMHLTHILPQLHAHPELFQELLDRQLGMFWPCLSTLLFLQDPDWWIAARQALITQSAARLEGVSGEVLNDLLALRQRRLHPTSAAQVHEIASGLYQSLNHMIQLANDLADPHDLSSASGDAPEEGHGAPRDAAELVQQTRGDEEEEEAS